MVGKMGMSLLKMAMMVCNHANFGDFMWYNHQIRWSLNIIQNLAEPLVNKPPKCCQAFLSAGTIWLRPSYGNGPTKAWYISMIFSGHFMISPVLSATFHRGFPPDFTSGDRFVEDLLNWSVCLTSRASQLAKSMRAWCHFPNKKRNFSVFKNADVIHSPLRIT